MKDLIVSNYNRYDEDKRAFGSRAEQLEFIYTKKLIEQYVTPSKTVIELGCGTGYYGLYLSDKCKSFYGVDLTPRNIDRFKEKITERKLKNVNASVGDATSLPEINDNSFDIVLNFGPMYHLSQLERQKTILESKRICKDGGIILFAYINKIGAYLRACLDEKMKSRYPNKQANERVLVEGVDDIMPDIFFYTMPEDVEHEVMENGLTVLKNAGVSFDFNAGDVNIMTNEQYLSWREILDYMFESRSCTGASNHAVLACQN